MASGDVARSVRSGLMIAEDVRGDGQVGVGISRDGVLVVVLASKGTFPAQTEISPAAARTLAGELTAVADRVDERAGVEAGPGDRPKQTRTQIGQVGPWTFFEIRNHSFGGDLLGLPLYEFEVDGVRRPGAEWYDSLDMAMVSAVGEKHTGQRGAGGTGVDTAAGWFMRMIGAVK